MTNSDNIKPTDDEEALRSAESSLDVEINLCVSIAQTAFKHMQNWPNTSSLAGVDRAIDTLRFFLADAQRLKDGGLPAVHTRLTAILNDVTAARAKWAETLGVLAAADSSDAKKLADHRSAEDKQRKERNDERLKQGQSQADEIKKLL